MSHRRIAVAVLAMALPLTVVGCSSGGKSTALNPQAGTKPAVAAPTASEGKDGKDGKADKGDKGDKNDKADGGEGADSTDASKAAAAASSAADVLGGDSHDNSGDSGDDKPDAATSTPKDPDASESGDDDSGGSHSGGDLSQWCVDFSKAMGDSIYAGRVPGAPSRDSVKSALQHALATSPADIKPDVSVLVDAHLAMAAGDQAAATQKMNSAERKAATDHYMAWSKSHC